MIELAGGNVVEKLKNEEEKISYCVVYSDEQSLYGDFLNASKNNKLLSMITVDQFLECLITQRLPPSNV